MNKIEIEADVPDGWVGVEYRPPKRGEWYLRHLGPCLADFNYSEPWIILRRVEPKKESWWQNLYAPGEMTAPMQRSRNAADDTARPIRLAVARFDYENGHPVSVALESVEGKG